MLPKVSGEIDGLLPIASTVIVWHGDTDGGVRDVARGTGGGHVSWQIAHVVHMQMSKEDFVDVVQWNTEYVEPLQRPRAHVENELVTVSQFNQEAPRGLFQPRHWQLATTADDSHFVRLQFFSPGVVDVSVCHRFDWQAAFAVVFVLSGSVASA